MSPLYLHEISAARKGWSLIPSFWWIFLNAMPQNALMPLKLTNGLCKKNSLSSPWIYIGLPTCMLGQPTIFLLVLQRHTGLGYVYKEKAIWNKWSCRIKTISEWNQIPVRNCIWNWRENWKILCIFKCLLPSSTRHQRGEAAAFFLCRVRWLRFVQQLTLEKWAWRHSLHHTLII